MFKGKIDVGGACCRTLQMTDASQMTKGKKEALILAQNHIDACFSVSRLNTFQEKCFSPPVQI